MKTIVGKKAWDLLTKRSEELSKECEQLAKQLAELKDIEALPSSDYDLAVCMNYEAILFRFQDIQNEGNKINKTLNNLVLLERFLDEATKQQTS